MKLYTSKDSRAVDQHAMKQLSTHPLVLMEHASRGIYEELGIRFWPFFDKDFVVLCGNGNNGGDGLCLARMLGLEGARVSVVLLNGEPRTKEAKAQLKILTKTLPLVPVFKSSGAGNLKRLINSKTIVIDAVFGTGFKSGLVIDKRIKSAFEACRKAFFKVSVDIPSGVDADSGEVSNGAFKADLSVSFALPKLGLYTAPGALYSGQVTVKSLFAGMPVLKTKYELLTETTTREMIKPLKRTINSHKGKYGHLAVIAPEKGMEGAVGMSVLAALRSGTGLISVIASDENIDSLRKRMPMLPAEAMIKSIDDIDPSFKGFSAVLVGPGYGRKRKALLKSIIKNSKAPLIIDADAINIIADDKELFSLIRKRKDLILTPHPGEMARLCKTSSDKIQEQRMKVLEGFCSDKQFSVLLKGYRSLLYAGSERIFINSTGGPSLAKGGSGDVLSGIIGSFCAQGLKPYEAGALGMFIHGACADVISEEKSSSDISMLPTDVINKLGETIGWLIEL